MKLAAALFLAAIVALGLAAGLALAWVLVRPANGARVGDPSWGLQA